MLMTILQSGEVGTTSFWGGVMHAVMPLRKCRIVWEIKVNRRHLPNNSKLKHRN